MLAAILAALVKMLIGVGLGAWAKRMGLIKEQEERAEIAATSRVAGAVEGIAKEAASNYQEKVADAEAPPPPPPKNAGEMQHELDSINAAHKARRMP
jgi:hypothetical protein